MFKAISVFSVLIMLAGCQITTERFMSNNRSKLINLKMGMSKNQVLNLMGNDSGSLTGTVGLSVGSVFITNPYKSELHHSSGETYEVLFYYTDDKNRDAVITDDELTPIAFKNNRLDGWGWSYWNGIVSSEELKVL